MKFTPVKHTALELLLKVGFMEAPDGKGYQMTIGSPKNTDVILAERMHAYIDGGAIDYHHDKKGKGKTHIASSYDLRCKDLLDILMLLDGQKEKVHPHNKWNKKLKTLLELIKN
jgi:hypothetical protein